MTKAYDFNQDFQRFKSAERDAPSAIRAQSRRVSVRRLQDGRQGYMAWDAHQLLEQLSDANQAHPGHPNG